jgi:hypothetical protein
MLITATATWIIVSVQRFRAHHEIARQDREEATR